MMQQMGGGGGPAVDTPLPDTAEKIQISSLSLLKMLKHGTAFQLLVAESLPVTTTHTILHAATISGRHQFTF